MMTTTLKLAHRRRTLNRREFLSSTGAMLIAAGASHRARGVAADDANWREKRLRLAHRRRRIIYNDDGDSRYATYYGGPPKDVADFLRRRFDWTRDTQVDSYFWCIGDGQDPPWGKPLPAGFDPNTTTLGAARKTGQEAVISLRMNDIHDAFGTVRYPFKLENRRMLIEPDGTKGKYPQSDVHYYTWSALNYAFPEVREHKFAYISKVAAQYVPDGFELDFFRHPAYFRPGEEKQNLPVMTEFIRRIRRRLDQIGKANGKPILLTARLADTPEKSIAMGLDGPAWIKQRLLDVLIIGGGYAPFWTAWTEYRDLAREHDIPAYPCFNCSLAHHLGNVEVVRGIASNWWHLGAQGVYLFNPFVPVDLKKIPAETMYGELNRLGDARTLAGLDKVFCQDYFSDNSVLMQRMTADPPLPTDITTEFKTIPLLVGDDLSNPPRGKQATCRLRLLTEPAAAPVEVKLNGNDQGEGQVADDKFREFAVASEHVWQGNNSVAVALRGPARKGRLTRLQLWVRFGEAG